MGPDADAVTGTVSLSGEPAPPRVLRMALRECRVCMGPHDAEIHDASLSIHRWFRGEVTKYLVDPDGPHLLLA